MPSAGSGETRGAGMKEGKPIGVFPLCNTGGIEVYAIEDDGVLADLLQDIKDMDFDVEFTGFDAAEVDALFSKVHDKEAKEDDFDVESELKQPAFSKEGDLWLLGKHRVYCGDSTKAESYAALMDGQKANLVLTAASMFGMPIPRG